MAGLDSVPWPTSPKRRVTASFAKPGIPAIARRIMCSSLDDDAECVSRIPEAGCFPDTGLSARPSDVFSPSALEFGGTTYSNAAGCNRPLSRSIHSWLLTTLTSCLRSHWLEFIIRNSTRRIRLKKNKRNGPKWDQENVAQKRRLPCKILGGEADLSDNACEKGEVTRASGI